MSVGLQEVDVSIDAVELAAVLRVLRCLKGVERQHENEGIESFSPNACRVTHSN